MDNYIQPGDVIEFTAPTGGVTAGTPLLIGSLLVVPAVTAAQTLPFNGHVTGVFEVTRATGGGTAWTEGVKIYWDNSAAKFTKTSSGNTLVGVAVAAAGDSAATGKVRLDGVAR
jgi:predicted RecA/RadA family phage recombinase